MVQPIKDNFVDLEGHRASLEQNVKKLRQSLQHWQAWEIEYEGLKEDIQSLEDDANLNHLEDPGEDRGELAFPGQSILLSGKERRLLLRDGNGRLREKQQVLGLLSRRVDYVQQNIKAVYSQLATADEKYAATQVLIQPEVRNEEGLPLTEILEELDAEGNVISGSTSKPGHAAPQVMEALRKAGITELPAKDVDVLEKLPNPAGENAETSASEGLPNKAGPDTVHNKEPGESSSSVPEVQKKSGKALKSRKRVSFAHDTKSADASVSGTDETKSKKYSPDRTKGRATDQEDIPDGGKPRFTSFDGEEERLFDPIIPNNESPEDATLRREMIQYNMGQIGAIVAELDLDENDSTNSGDESDEEDYENSSIEEEEDQFGRTSQRVLSDDYVAEMQKLQQRLKNVGPMAVQSPLPVVDGDEIVNNNITEFKDNLRPQKDSAKKEVRFANDLDIQEAPNKLAANTTQITSDDIEPRDPHPKPIHTSTVIERPFDPSSTSKPTEPDEFDEFDPNLLRQEVASEYHRMRNRISQRQGGVSTREEEDETGEVALTEAEGGPKKMSRFKAARLGRQGL